MDRTLRAAATAALFGLVVVGGSAWFLGMPTGTALVAGVVAAAVLGGLIVAAARRAATFDPPSHDPSAHPPDGADDR